jgi:hypothetical protein
MNRWGRKAREHWQQHRPGQYGQIPDPQAFFTRLGEDVSAEINSLALALAGDDRPGEGYLDKVGRLRTARLTAQEHVLREMLLPAEADQAHAEGQMAEHRRRWEPGQP